MFNPFFRPYLPGFRVGPDGVPGFNIDDNGLPQRAIASFDGTLPDWAAQPYPDAAQAQVAPSISFSLPGAEGWVLSAPLPGFRVSPQDDAPGFNVGPQDDAPGFSSSISRRNPECRRLHSVVDCLRCAGLRGQARKRRGSNLG